MDWGRWLRMIERPVQVQVQEKEEDYEEGPEEKKGE